MQAQGLLPMQAQLFELLLILDIPAALLRQLAMKALHITCRVSSHVLSPAEMQAGP